MNKILLADVWRGLLIVFVSDHMWTMKRSMCGSAMQSLEAPPSMGFNGKSECSAWIIRKCPVLVLRILGSNVSDQVYDFGGQDREE
jgi:hypothetical protein